MMQDRQITLTRLIAAPPEAVWRCWTDPEILPKWFGPEGYSCITKEIDLREGGLWRFDMIGPDGKVWPNRHRYTLSEPPKRLEFLLDADDDGSEPKAVVVTLASEANGTRITQVMTFPTPEMCRGALAFGADRLGQTTLAKLDAAAQRL
ncbi:MAG: activator of Hsp90 ATPase 1 family protein [Rhodobacteraceae bacterium]|uniref:SRPBCC domain-containing protein n=1 Tax=Cypionkella sp. TaxID=2811411 RepID=UPI0013246DC0|nr:SRPBCC domain-containing protein [Cypionkella sp.]KAF0172818.1 MAG: activator of Hsp90 ATPase 1 family protein [Paracoccaceae bacterium]